MTTALIYTFIEPELLARTVARLEPIRVFVHVDAKVDQQPFENAIREQDRHRVEFIEPRHVVNWAGYSQVDTIRDLLHRAFEVTAPDEYIIMMSGQDYPLYSGAAINKFFEAANGRQFLRYFRIDESDDGYRDQFYARHYRDLPFLTHRVLKPRERKVRTASVLGVDKIASFLPPPQVPKGLTPCFGPTHFAITCEFAKYLDSLITPEIERFFKTTFCPEELIFQTLAASGPRPVNNGSDREDGSEPFVGRGNWRYANLHHIHESLIKVYTEDDWIEVAASQSLILRKMTMKRSRELMDHIDNHFTDVPIERVLAGPKPHEQV